MDEMLSYEIKWRRGLSSHLHPSISTLRCRQILGSNNCSIPTCANLQSRQQTKYQLQHPCFTQSTRNHWRISLQRHPRHHQYSVGQTKSRQHLPFIWCDATFRYYVHIQRIPLVLYNDETGDVVTPLDNLDNPPTFPHPMRHHHGHINQMMYQFLLRHPSFRNQ
ncbi:hypothetical protein BDQ12DRAFT_694636 [Crucibulum laeve]|uniref:Uncharacterized protein n=1 Tax=Crucibulum laeve TaxID=68775 RepID=A0A5C3LQI1_9AGAR|nr:hypothetical protein BDQ12DRAFT_694644 [Crucibulum laeve]TFK31001.1 hypothetical protein BDQ12DRAFT_694636 [Crucibulum laeve]